MKILITTDWYVPVINGVVTSIVNLTKGLQELGHEVKILTLSQNNRSFKDGQVVYIGSISANRIYPGARIALTYENKYIEELIKWQPDIVHSQCEFSTFRMALNISQEVNIPIVHTYHTVYEDYTHYISVNKRIGKKLAVLFTRRILEYTNCVIVPTEKVRSLLNEYGVNKEIHVVPTGIDLDRFNISLDIFKKQELRKRVGIPEGNRVLIYVGRLAKEKNLEEILLFLSRLNDKKLTLLIVGDGPYRDVLEEYVDKLGVRDKVIFTGMVSPNEIHLYYQIGDVFVSASNSETQGLTYIEALASGLPALCKKDPCLKDVIRDGINGWQYETFEHFSEKLDFMLKKSTYDKLSRNAKLQAMKEYSSSTFAERIENVYRNVSPISYSIV